MKRTSHRLALVTLLVTLPLGFACKSSESAHGASTASGVQAAANDLKTNRVRLDETLTALDQLTGATSGELEPLFKKFSSSLDRLTASAQSTKKRADDMQIKGKAYFAQWDQELATITNEDIREQSAERREKVEKEFDKVAKLYQGVREDYQPLQANLTDVRTALAADLTAAGVKSVAGAAKSAKKSGSKLGESLDELIKKFEELGVKLSSNLGPPPEAPKK